MPALVLGKDADKVTATDLLRQWETLFFAKNKCRYGNFNVKEKTLVKKLIGEYSAQEVLQAIKWFVMNPEKVQGFRGVPTVSAFYGFRRSIFPMANGVAGSSPIIDRQFKEDDGKDKF